MLKLHNKDNSLPASAIRPMIPFVARKGDLLDSYLVAIKLRNTFLIVAPQGHLSEVSHDDWDAAGWYFLRELGIGESADIINPSAI